MKMKNLDIEMQNTLDITNMSQKEIEDAIHAVLSGQKTFAEVAAESPGPMLEIKEITPAPILAEKVDDGVYNYPHDLEFVGFLDDSDGEYTLIEDEDESR